MARARNSTRITRSDIIACIPDLRAFAWVLTNDIARADDLVASALTRALGGARPLPARACLNQWMFTILHILHHGDAEVTNQRGALDDGFPATPESTNNVGAAGSELRKFADAFSHLRADEREALMLDAASGLSREEILAVCGGPPGMLAIRVMLARQKLLHNVDWIDAKAMLWCDKMHVKTI